MEGSRNYHLSTKQVAKKFEFQTKSPIGCSCICSSGAAFRERQNRRGKGIPTEDLWFIPVYPGRHAAVLRAHERVTSITWPFSLLSSNFSRKMENRTNCRLRFLHKIGISGIVLQVLGAPLFIVAIVLVQLGTEIVCGHGVEDCFNFGNQGLLTFNSNLWALISHQTWFYFTI